MTCAAVLAADVPNAAGPRLDSRLRGNDIFNHSVALCGPPCFGINGDAYHFDAGAEGCTGVSRAQGWVPAKS